jgi:plasmid stability protein
MHQEVAHMPTLHVRSVPEELYQRLHALAREQNRSLSAQVVTLLEQAVHEAELRQERAAALQSIRRRRFAPPAQLADSTALLREDRSR